MKVVILCGGLGTRLREETEFRPKPMVEIGDRPVLWHIMKIYSCFGFNEFVLALGYKGKMIKEYFYNYHFLNNDFTIELGNEKEIAVHHANDEMGWKITLADTGENTLKGARLKKIEKYIDGDEFLVTYGDGLADVNLKTLIKFHKSHGKLATLTGVNIVSRFGELKIDGNRVADFREKPTDAPGYINGGFFIFKKKILDYLSTDDNCDLEYGTLEKIASEGNLMVYKHPGSWACMDTLRDMEYLNGLWARKKAFWRIW